MFCKYCGETVMENSKFCRACGESLQEAHLKTLEEPSSLKAFINPLSYEKNKGLVWLWLLPFVDIIISSIYAFKAKSLDSSLHNDLKAIDIILGIFKFSTTLILLLSVINIFVKFYI